MLVPPTYVERVSIVADCDSRSMRYTYGRDETADDGASLDVYRLAGVDPFVQRAVLHGCGDVATDQWRFNSRRARPSGGGLNHFTRPDASRLSATSARAGEGAHVCG